MLLISVLKIAHLSVFKQKKSQNRANLPLSYYWERGPGVRAVFQEMLLFPFSYYTLVSSYKRYEKGN